MDGKILGEGVGALEKLAALLARWWRRRHPLNPRAADVHEEWEKGYAILGEMNVAGRNDPVALRHLTRRAFQWSGGCTLRLSEAMPYLYLRLSGNVEVPSSMRELRSLIRADMKTLRRIERRLTWPRGTRFLLRPMRGKDGRKW